MKGKTIVAAGLMMALSAGLATAVPLVTEAFSDTAGFGATNWASGVTGNPPLDDPEVAAPSDGLQVTADGQLAQTADQISQDGGSIAGYNSGDWIWGNNEIVTNVVFDFYASADGVQEGPDGLLLYLQADGVSWYFDINDIVDLSELTAGWETGIAVDVTGIGDWYRMDGGTETDGAFLGSLNDVDEFGWVLTWQDGIEIDNQVYAFDNVTLNGFPEPGTYAMLGFALVSLGTTFRRRLNDFLSRFFKRD
jgi:hypothetical protein